MNLKRCFLTENNCYKSGKKHTVKGIMVHSTGANNPNLKRYVQPDDGLLGKNTYNNAWNQPTPGGRQVCVHGFIGKLADGSIATYQTLPWNMVGWHSGSGSKGNANRMGYIGFEICEDGLTDAVYFEKVYIEAVELCAHLCEQYNLNPTTDIICHSEGYSMGIASNHGDVMHWFPKFGKTMDTFRIAVAKTLGGTGVTAPVVPQTPSQKPITLAVGDVVAFMGKSHYSSANAAVAVSCRPGKAKITSIFPKGKHPYHLVRITGGTSDVYGWVDAADIHEYMAEKTVQVGSSVKIKGTLYSTGNTIPGWVKQKTHVVSKLSNGKVLLGANGGINSWVNLSDVELV